MTNQDFYQLIEQRLGELERRLYDVVDVALCDAVRKTLQIAKIDLPISLGKARVILETVITDIYRRELPDAETKPLFNMIEALIKQKKNLFSEKRIADLNYIRINGNMVLHPDDYPDLTMTDVEPIVLMVLSLVDWYLTQYVPNKQGFLVEDNHQIPLPDNPYRGLEAFRPEDEELFFGRNETLEELRAVVKKQRLVLMLGASGCGKSSLAYAGLIPALQRAGWLVAYCRPKGQAFTELAHSIAPLLYPDPIERGKQFKQLAPALEKGEVNLSFLLKTALNQHQKSNLLLLVDQFEESYQVNSPDFHHCLWEAVQHTENFTLLLTLRADFMGYALADSAFSALLKTDPPFLVESITAEQSLRSIIEQPAKIKNTKLEPLLIERIVRDVRVSQHQISLPLLEFTLTKLWKKQQDRLLTHRAYSELGGVETALARHAESVYEKLKAAGQESVMCHTLLQLVFQGKETADTKQVVSRQQFSDQDWEMVVTLANERLVVTNRQDEVETAELAHDSLISHWERLVDWLKEDRPFRIWRNSLQGYLQDNTLLSGAALVTAQEWLAKRPEEIRSDERALITRSVEKIAQDQAEKERQTRLLKEHLDKALITQSLFLADLSRQAEIDDDKPATAMRLALDVLPGTSESYPERPFVWQAYSSLLAGMNRQYQGVLEHNTIVKRAVFSPDGKCLLTHTSKTVYLWDVSSRQFLHCLRGHKGEDIISSVAFSPDSKYVITTSVSNITGVLGTDRTARLWEVDTGKPLVVFKGHEDSIWSAAFSPNGQRVVTASEDKTARLWDANTGKQLAVLQGHEDAVIAAAFSPDGRRVVTADDKTARLWDSDGEELEELGYGDGQIRSIAFSPNGKSLVTADNETARLWDVYTGEELIELQGHKDSIWSASFSPDGKRVVTASDDGTVRLWNANTGKQLLVLQGHKKVRIAAFSPNSKYVITASFNNIAGFDLADSVGLNENYTARLWDADTGKQLKVLQGHRMDITSTVFSSDGGYVVTASHDGTTRLWDADTGKPLAVLQGHEDAVISAAFSPDGKRLVKLSVYDALLLDAETGMQLAVLQGHIDRVNSAAFSSDGKRVVTASDDDTARLWDAETGMQLAVLQGHRARVNSAAFSSDGKRVVTASDDDTARLWDADSGQPLAILWGHEKDVTSAFFSPDGRHIITASEDNTSRIWLTFPTLEEMIAYAQKMLPPRISEDPHDANIPNWRLTCAEREQYFLEEVERCKKQD